MGGKVVLPEPDANITKCIKNFKLTPKEMSGFWKTFQKLDKAKSGLISLQAYFKSIECERNMITDCLLELLEIEHGTSYEWFLQVGPGGSAKCISTQSYTRLLSKMIMHDD